MLLPAVYPILDTASFERAGLKVEDAAEALLEGGAEMLQFRHKSVWGKETVEKAASLARMCAAAAAAFVVNDRADYAAIIAQGESLCHLGLHLGQEDLAPADARIVTGNGIFIGFSTHNAEQMRAAAVQPIDYVAFGPVFGTASKERPDPEVGIEGLRAARALTSKPLVAIGGITRDNARHCWNAGADSVAVIAGMLPQPCTKRTLRESMIKWRQLTAK